MLLHPLFLAPVVRRTVARRVVSLVTVAVQPPTLAGASVVDVVRGVAIDVQSVTAAAVVRY